MDILLIHGYNVTSTKTYGHLPLRLKKLGHTVKDVFLAKYVTLDDDITLDDIAKGLQAALRDVFGLSLEKKKFACLTHSTGGVVVRHWIQTYYERRKNSMPISHLIMLTPPNHGSRLAELGLSRLSRLRSMRGYEPGVRVLRALELASEFQWEMNAGWIDQEFHKIPGFYPAVVTGQWIDHRLWDPITPATYERGSDGVVRAASANLNFRRHVISAEGSVVSAGIDGIPFLITPRTSHSDERFGIVGGIPVRGNHAVVAAIEEALRVRDAVSYKKLADDFHRRTSSLQQQERYYDGSKLDRYSQVVFRLRDTQGNRLSDYAIEFLDGNGMGGQLPTGFFGDKHKNGANPELFAYYLNYDRLKNARGGRLGLEIQTLVHSLLVDYEPLRFMKFRSVEDLIRPNETTYVDVILKRRLNKNIFRLTRKTGYQKINGKPGRQWI